MKNVVITGGTRGIGFGLANAFLALGCNVSICGRTSASVQDAVGRLASHHSATSLFGHPCDVTLPEQLEALWDAARDHFGPVDIWINNAGVSHPRAAFWEQAPRQIRSVADTNLLGVMYGSRVAFAGMLQQGTGALYNMEGLGSDGRKINGMTLYSSTKCAVRYFTEALAKEARDTPVLVGGLSPGMVVTDLLVREYRSDLEGFEQAKRIFNILADRVETVTPWLAGRILANKKSGVRIKWLTRKKIAARFISALYRKRNLFD